MCLEPTFQTGCKATLVRNAQPNLLRKKRPAVVRAFPPYMCCPLGTWEGLGKWHVWMAKAQPQDRRDWEQRSGRKPGISSLQSTDPLGTLGSWAEVAAVVTVGLRLSLEQV